MTREHSATNTKMWFTSVHHFATKDKDKDIDYMKRKEFARSTECEKLKF